MSNSRQRRTIGCDDLRKGTLQGRAFSIVRRLAKALLRLVLGFTVLGEEHVPADGPVIIIVNHLHNADPVLAAVACPRPVHFMAKRELFSIPLLGWVIRRVGTFPVDRGAADRSAIRRASATLEQGIALGMFPEGTRSRTGALKEGLPGAGLVALRSQAPIVPVAIIGSDRLPGNGPYNRRGRFRRGILVKIGPSFHLTMSEDRAQLTADEATHQIMRALAAQLPPDYRGVYGESHPDR